MLSTRNPHSVSTFLVDGVVAGTWRAQGSGIVLDSFNPLPRATMRQVEDEAEQLAAFHR